jgi:hypothetical protein
MYKLTQADMIWNRACGKDRLRSRPGDRALADLIRAHGLAMNGGVFHAVECLTARQLSNAAAGYRFYGLHAAASLLLRAKRMLEKFKEFEFHEQQLDAQYAKIIPGDSSLVRRFEKHLKANPSDYASLRPKAMG